MSSTTSSVEIRTPFSSYDLGKSSGRSTSSLSQNLTMYIRLPMSGSSDRSLREGGNRTVTVRPRFSLNLWTSKASSVCTSVPCVWYFYRVKTYMKYMCRLKKIYNESIKVVTYVQFYFLQGTFLFNFGWPGFQKCHGSLRGNQIVGKLGSWTVNHV